MGLFGILLWNTFQQVRSQDLASSEQIQQVLDTGDTVAIDLHLPFYRSQSGYFINPSFQDEAVLEMTIGTTFSLKKQQTSLVLNKKKDLLALFPKAKQLVLLSPKGSVIKRILLHKN